MIFRAKHTERQRWLQIPLASLLWEFLQRHLACIQHRYGPVDTFTVVPSHPTTRAGVDHLKQMHGRVRGWPQPWDLDVLAKTRADTASDRRQAVQPDLFTVTGGRDLRGRHVVILDDTFTSGGTLASAAAALRYAGAARVVGLSLGRQVNPNRTESREFLDQLRGRDLDLSTCALHDHQPLSMGDQFT